MRQMILLGSIAVLALAGCGLISSPPIANPFQLDGKTTAIQLAPSAQAAGSAKATAQFEDLTSIPSTGPSGFNYTFAIKSVSFGTGCPASLPPSVEVTLNATIKVSDGSGANARSSTATATGVKTTLTINGQNVTVGALTGQTISFNISTLLPILQTGGLNTAELDASVNTKSTPDLAGCTMTIIWGGGEGVVKI